MQTYLSIFFVQYSHQHRKNLNYKFTNERIIFVEQSTELINTKDKRMIILYAVPISVWHMLGKENMYFYYQIIILNSNHEHKYLKSY